MNKQVKIHIDDKFYFCDMEVLKLINRLCDKIELLEYNRDNALEYNKHLINHAKYHLNVNHIKKLNKIIKGDI